MIKAYEILDDNGVVINNILADVDFVEQQYPGKYREVVSDLTNKILKIEFMRRFNQDELDVFHSLIKTDPELEVFQTKFFMMTLENNYVDLKSVETSTYLDSLVVKGIISPERKIAILA